ncbi:MAG: hypothetical protein JG776_453 [Caloramator sp.]|jgi:hypothetical protein|uniref:HK97 gp10 family phage protein n=1 Tax=Caloramator sp. TaxID=1871330 RepID=UPI001D483BE4|nr:HK97 gp10 family phage protein [Caloramator sp.]MBZ4662771.1 hypothetical protein [Caloramator sp.]
MSDYKLEWKGNLAKKIVRKAAKKALLTCGADLQGKSAEQAPIDMGDLKRNCSVSPIQDNNGEMTVMVGYDLPYARRQHEGLHFKHPKGGKAKYLEDPYKENVKKYEKYIADKIKQVIGD